MSVAHAVGSPEPGRPRPTALVVLVNWRQPALTVRAARSVQDQLARGDRLVVVDNGSGDDSVPVLRGEGLTVVDTGTNLGFAGGVNAGAHGMTEDALVLLNNDAVAEAGFLDALLAPFTEVGAGRVGATTAQIRLSGRWCPAAARDEDQQVLVGLDGSRWRRCTRPEDGVGLELLNSTGNLVDRTGNGYDRDWLRPVGEVSPARDVFGLCGGACAIRRTAWEQVGGFREDLFMYYEDTDLSWRLRRQGWRVEYAGEAVAVHEHAASSGTLSPMFLRVNARNRVVVAAEHAPWDVAVRALARTVVHVVRGPHRRAVAQGLGEALSRLPAALAARRRR